jgi:hypothetical protein
MKEAHQIPCLSSLHFADDLFMLANQLAKFCKHGIVHFRYALEGQCYYAVAWCVARRRWSGGLWISGYPTLQDLQFV